jgi:hypothetical protein
VKAGKAPLGECFIERFPKLLKKRLETLYLKILAGRQGGRTGKSTISKALSSENVTVSGERDGVIQSIGQDFVSFRKRVRMKRHRTIGNWSKWPDYGLIRHRAAHFKWRHAVARS